MISILNYHKIEIEYLLIFFNAMLDEDCRVLIDGKNVVLYKIPMHLKIIFQITCQHSARKLFEVRHSHVGFC